MKFDNQSCTTVLDGKNKLFDITIKLRRVYKGILMDFA